MIIKDESVLDEFRTRGLCERCRMPAMPLDPHHCFKTRGAGRLDLRCNLIGICWHCHRLCHHDHKINFECQEIIAKREGTTVQAIMDYLNLVLRTPKESPQPETPWSVAA